MLLPRLKALENIMEFRSVTDKIPVGFLQFLKGSLREDSDPNP